MAIAKPLTVGISSTALFDLSISNELYQQRGLEAYRHYQISQEEVPLEPGDGFYLVEKLLNINKLSDKNLVEVLLLSRNSADTGLRVFNSIRAHSLDITRAAFCGGESPYRYIKAFGCDLFLSTNADDVRLALAQNIAAATLFGRTRALKESSGEALKLAFDGDSVLFSDEAERVYQHSGLDAFSDPVRSLITLLQVARLRPSSPLCIACSRIPRIPESYPYCCDCPGCSGSRTRDSNTKKLGYSIG